MSVTMTTTLVARARHQAGAGPTWRLDILLRELADALESSASRVAELEGENAELESEAVDLASTVRRFQAQNDRSEAATAALSEQLVAQAAEARALSTAEGLVVGLQAQLERATGTMQADMLADARTRIALLEAQALDVQMNEERADAEIGELRGQLDRANDTDPILIALTDGSNADGMHNHSADRKPAEPRPIDDVLGKQVSEMRRLWTIVNAGGTEALLSWGQARTKLHALCIEIAPDLADALDARPSQEPRPMSEAPRKECDRCNGSGSILSEPDSHLCEVCHGSGWLPTTTAAGGSGDES